MISSSLPQGKGPIKDGDRIGRDKLDRDLKGEKKDLEGDQTFIFGDQRRGGGRGGDRGGGIRGRGGRPGALGGRGGRSDKENEEMMKSGRMPNGPGGRGGTRGGGVGFGGRGGRGGGRTFASRARSDRDGGDSYNTIDVWENCQADGTKETPMKVGMFVATNFEILGLGFRIIHASCRKLTVNNL